MKHIIITVLILVAIATSAHAATRITVGSGGNGSASVPVATTSTAGKVKPDGSTITVETDGTIHAAAGDGSASNITSGTLDGDRLPGLSTTKKGGVPATGTPSGMYLKDDGTWANPGGNYTASQGVMLFSSTGCAAGWQTTMASEIATHVARGAQADHIICYPYSPAVGSASFTFPSVSASGAAGSMTTAYTADAGFTFPAVSSTGAVGTFTALGTANGDAAFNFPSVSSDGAAGVMTVSYVQDGSFTFPAVSATGAVGTLTVVGESASTNTITETYESGTINATSLTSGGLTWTGTQASGTSKIVSSPTHAGTRAWDLEGLNPGKPDVSVTVTCRADNITWWWKTNNDGGDGDIAGNGLYIDGTFKGGPADLGAGTTRISGTGAIGTWSQYSTAVTAGSHTLKWMINPDAASLEVGETYTLDDVVIPVP